MSNMFIWRKNTKLWKENCICQSTNGIYYKFNTSVIIPVWFIPFSLMYFACTQISLRNKITCYVYTSILFFFVRKILCFFSWISRPTMRCVIFTMLIIFDNVTMKLRRIDYLTRSVSRRIIYYNKSGVTKGKFRRVASTYIWHLLSVKVHWKN